VRPDTDTDTLRAALTGCLYVSATRSSTMSSPSKLRAAILIVSETASKDPSTDKGIPALQEVFAQKAGDRWTYDETRIVPDDVLDIQRTITEWADGESPFNLVVTSGGTGFTQKDVTPEVSACSTVDASRSHAVIHLSPKSVS